LGVGWVFGVEELGVDPAGAAGVGNGLGVATVEAQPAEAAAAVTKMKAARRLMGLI
jgi:hypothetical protein